MKKLLLLTCAICFFFFSFGQNGFTWEKTDSISKTQSQIYSAAKMFIAKTWKSSKDVIQNDDKETGVILIKGVSSQNFAVNLGLCPMEYIFNYNVTFKMKDGKYKITIDNVHCTSAHGGTNYQELRPIEPSDQIPYPFKTGAVSNKKAVELMQSLKQELQAILDAYIDYLKYTKSEDTW